MTSMSDHLKDEPHHQAIREQLTAEERAVFDRPPAREWLAQIRERLSAMSVADAAAALRAEIPGFQAAQLAETKRTTPGASK